MRCRSSRVTLVAVAALGLLLGCGEDDVGRTPDLTAPAVTVDTLMRWDATPELTGGVDDATAAVTVTVDGQVSAATNNGDGTWTLADNTVTALAPGTYDVAVTATDAAGNVGTDATTNELTIAGGDIGAGLTGVSYCSVAWGDYDNDGDLDLALAGRSSSGNVCKVYRNDAGTFIDIGAGLTGVYDCSFAWGDYDNDGDLDLALAGYTGSGRVSKVYRNDGVAGFTDIGAGLTAVEWPSLAWGDYDNDGDLDLALAGWASGIGPVARVYRNDGGTFTDIGTGLTGVYRCSLAWGDYDNDGDLDLALAGYGGGYQAKVYRNDGGTFTDIGAGLAGVMDCSLAWGDYDNDGDLDLALAGSGVSKVYRNDSGTFTDIGAGLTGVMDCSLAWGDYDNDGDLDLALAGYVSFANYISKVYRNEGGVFNAAPAAPTGLSATAGSKPLTGSPEFTNLSATVTAVFSAVTGTQITFGTGSSTVTGADSTFLSDGVAPGDLVRLDSDGDSWYEVATVDTETQLTLAEDYQGSGPPGTGSVLKAADRTAFASQVVAGGFVRLDADGAWCEVATVESDTRLTLAAPYAGAGGSGAASVRTVVFRWAAPAVADETPEAGLSYNLRVGTTSGGNEVFSGMARADGRRKLPARGAAQPGLSVNEWTLTLPADTYYWSVQAVDTAFAGSAWPAEKMTTVP